MPIKLRILLCVLGLQILGFGLLIAYQANEAEHALGSLRSEQVAAMFNGNLHQIDAQTNLIERSVVDLKTAGQSFQRMAQSLPVANLEAPLQAHLFEHFSNFADALGGGIWYEPHQFDPQRLRYGPYVFRRDGEMVFTWDLNTEAYDYPRQQWYLDGLPADWPRDRRRERDVYWTAPYYDDAGSMALMMSAVAPMYDTANRIIGVATVDWSMESVRAFVSRIRVTPNSRPFLIDQQSGRFVGFALDSQLVMQSADLFDWSKRLLAQAQVGKVGELTDVRYGNKDYRVYFMATRIGLVFGVLVPRDEMLVEVQSMLDRSLVTGVLISIGFLIVMTLTLGLLFRPFSRVMALIGQSIRHGRGGELRLTPLEYAARNEFTPIIAALNEVYAAVDAYTQRLSEANERLSVQGGEIARLNASLEHKVAERTRQLAEKNIELSASIGALRDTQQQLVDAEKHAALNRLVAGIAHEVNTPLGVALTAGSHLAEEARRLGTLLSDGQIRRSDLDAFITECAESLGIVEFNLDRAATLVRGFKQISVDQSSEARRGFVVGDYIGDILLSLRPQLKRTRIVVQVECPAGVMMDGYPGAFSQVLANLITNSLVHGFEEGQAGTISIVVSLRDDAIQLTYRDSGKGIPAQAMPHIFDPFFTTNRERGGSGLGLHIVFNLVTRKLGGHIYCESQPGEGVRFVVDLPLIAPQPAPLTVSLAGPEADPAVNPEADPEADVLSA